MINNQSLRKANKTKEDEFYTQLTVVEKEMKYYREYFKDKTIFLNCDDPIESNFWKYFELNFFILGIKKLVSTHYEESKPSYKLEINRDYTNGGLITSKDIVKTKLKQNGDFRSPEAIEILKEADIVITNPPFSLFREYVAQLMEYEKKFIIIGNMNAITYKEIFPLIKNNKLWLGMSLNGTKCSFIVPDSYDGKNVYIDTDGIRKAKINNALWFTNLDVPKRHEKIILWKKYNAEEYPKYDNFDAINVNRVADIPVDYKGLIGVPITFLDKYNPNQFRIIDALNRYSILDTQKTNEYVQKNHLHTCNINGKSTYFRIVIQKIEE